MYVYSKTSIWLSYFDLQLYFVESAAKLNNLFLTHSFGFFVTTNDLNLEKVI